MKWNSPANPIDSHAFRKLRLRLAISYFGVVSVILTAFVFSTYQVISYKLNQQLKEHLLSLATSSADALEIIEDEYRELQSQEGDLATADNELIQSIQAKKKKYLQRSVNGELQLSEPLNDLIEDSAQKKSLEDSVYSSAQNIEWFNRRGILLVKEGILNIGSSLQVDIPPEGILHSGPDQWSYTLPVYLSGNEPMLLGYVRATVSTKSNENALQNIRLALGIGVILALSLTILCGNWLTAQALSPLATNVNQLQQFTSDAAHELRTPLTVIKGAVQILADEQTSADDIQKVNLITDASRQMNQLVDDLLLLTRLDAVGTAAKADWRLIPIDEVIEDLAHEFEVVALEKEIKLCCKPLQPAKVLGHAAHLKSLISNLISNALRYTPSKGVITLSLNKKSDHVLIQVADTGIGIEQQYLDKIFDRFWRAERARAHYQSGSGLGLAIAKTIVNTHGGNLWVESELRRGSTFTVKLPTV
ncbi:MAG: sensor histidine kinase [Leptolyngbyaceae cyanobacterium]